MTVIPSQQLPPPGGSQQEVLFRRMLLQCSQRMQQPKQQSGAAGDWHTDPRFHCIVEELQKKLDDLEHASVDKRPGPDVLQQYQAHVKAIAAALQPAQLPAYCLRISAQDRTPVPEHGSSGSISSSSRAAGRSAVVGGPTTQAGGPSGRAASGRFPQEQQQSGRGAAAADGNTGQQPSRSAAAAGSSEGGFTLSSNAQDKLRTQQHLQDDLTNELLDMGQELKASTLAMQNAIRYRGKLLDDAEVALVNSTENAKSVAAKAKEQYKQGSWNLCHTCIIVLSVTVIFSGMVVAIRVSVAGVDGFGACRISDPGGNVTTRHRQTYQDRGST